MTNTTKYIAAFVVAVAIFGSYFFPKSQIVTQMLAGSPAGASFNTSKVAGQQIILGTTTAYSMLNTDTSDRTITGFDSMLRGATPTSTTYSLACATSTSASSLNGNTNYVYNSSFATTTFGSIIGAGTYVATSSPGITGTTTASVLNSLANPFVRNWASGTYLDCLLTTADSYNAFNSTTNGTINFSYRGQ